MNILKQFINAGCANLVQSDNLKYVRALNAIALFYSINAALFVFIFAWFNALQASFWLSGFTLIFLSVPLFSHLGLIQFAKYYLVFSIYFGIGFFSAILGKESWAEYIYITAFSVPYLLTSKINAPLNYLSLAMSIGLFILFRFTDVFSAYAIYGVNPNLKYPVIGFVFIMPFVVLNIMKSEQIKHIKLLEHEMKEKELLSRELNHRVKNNFQIITSLFSLQMRQQIPEKATLFLEMTRNRVYTMALIHERIHNGESLTDISYRSYLSSIIEMILRLSGKTTEIKFKQSGDDASIDFDKSVPIGLVICEIVTNSIKHAFENIKEGEIYLHVEKNPEVGLIFKIGDNGNSTKDEQTDLNSSNGIGTMLINDLITQVEGSIEKTTIKGTHYTICLDHQEP